MTTGLKEAILEFFLGIPWRGLGRAPMPGRRGREAGMWRARRWASPYSLGEPSNEVGRASTKGPLGEPSNEVGRASTKGPLGEPVGRARTHWASQLGEPVLIGRATQPLSQWPTPAPAWRCACSALCLLGTSS